MDNTLPDVSPITEYLFLSSLPKREQAGHILDLGVRLIVSMPLYWPPRVYREPPFAFVHCPTIDSPLTPIPIFMLRRGVQAAIASIQAGQGVLIHCKQGVHRSVAMATCILIAQGYTPQDAMKFIVEKRPVADPYAPYIQSRIRKFEQDWRARNGLPADPVRRG